MIYKLINDAPPMHVSFYSAWTVLSDKYDNRKFSRKHAYEELEKSGFDKETAKDHIEHMKKLEYIKEVE